MQESSGNPSALAGREATALPPKIAANLTFHGIGKPPTDVSDAERALWLSRPRFEAMIELAAATRDLSLVLTFDDGNESDVTFALPALVQRGLRACFFLPAGRLDQGGYLASDEVRTLVASGMTIGTHGMHHRPWRRLSDADLHEELVTARTILEDVSASVITEASCPFGAYNRRVLGRLRTLGYTRVYTSDGGTTRSDAWLQPRVSVRATDTPEGLFHSLCNQPLQSRLIRRSKGIVKRWV